jgi:hypothetical protein
MLIGRGFEMDWYIGMELGYWHGIWGGLALDWNQIGLTSG